MLMANRYQGPCEDCGTHVDRRIKAGKGKRCVDCALEYMAAQHTDYANSHPAAWARMQARNAELSAQYKAREGPLYERWKAGRERAIEAGLRSHNPATRRWAEGLARSAEAENHTAVS